MCYVDCVLVHLKGEIGHTFQYGGKIKWFAIAFNTTINARRISMPDLEVYKEWEKYFNKKVPYMSLMYRQYRTRSLSLEIAFVL